MRASALEILQPGMHTTVQDLGRFGYQALGVPVAGALDPASLRLANAVVGNSQGTAAFEFFYQGPTLRVAAKSARVAAANADIEILGDRPRTIPPWQSIRLEHGEKLRVTAPKGSVCGYLAIEGGLALAPVLGSLATYTRSRIGGFEGRALRKGDRLPLNFDHAEKRQELRLKHPPRTVPPAAVRVVSGPQREFFTADAIETFFTETFTVSKAADRMGLRLDGPTLSHVDSYNIVSDGIVTGAIQVPGSGQPIVLLADHQTTGGYPKIATTISADLPAVGRLKPGDPIRFHEVAVEEAEDLARSFEDHITRRALDVVQVALAPILRTASAS